MKKFKFFIIVDGTLEAMYTTQANSKKTAKEHMKKDVYERFGSDVDYEIVTEEVTDTE